MRIETGPVPVATSATRRIVDFGMHGSRAWFERRSLMVRDWLFSLRMQLILKLGKGRGKTCLALLHHAGEVGNAQLR
jgi:hypothetical protein